MSYKKGIQSNLLKDFKISIGGVEITEAQIVSMKIKWSIKDLKCVGSIILLDETDMVEETPIRGGDELSLNLVDYDDIKFDTKMEIISVEYTRSQSNSYTVKLEFMDIPSINALGSYIPLSFEETDMVSIINHDETLKSFLTDKSVDFCTPSFKHKNFIIPLNMSFYKVCNWLKKNNNLLFFQDRENYYIQPISYFNGKGKQGDLFIYKPNNENYRRSIYQLNTYYGNKVENYALKPDINHHSLDINKKEILETKQTYASSIDEISSKGVTPHDFQTNGERLSYKTHLNAVDKAKYILHNTTSTDIVLEILVPGQFDNNIGTVVELDLVNFFTGTEPDKNLNGEWLIYEVVDIINPPDFVQRITLVRSKFSK